MCVYIYDFKIISFRIWYNIYFDAPFDSLHAVYTLKIVNFLNLLSKILSTLD